MITSGPCLSYVWGRSAYSEMLALPQGSEQAW